MKPIYPAEDAERSTPRTKDNDCPADRKERVRQTGTIIVSCDAGYRTIAIRL